MTTMVNVLGRLVIEQDGSYPKIPRKGRALLGYLAVQRGQPVTRELLSDLLWPYQQTEQARHSLRNCLLELKKKLGPAVISDFGSCRLAAGSDFEGFADLAASTDINDLRCVSARYRGELLENFDLDSEPWREWLGAERAEARNSAMQAIFRLAKYEFAARRDALALNAARRVIQLEPYCEAAHRLLMQVLAAAGRGPEALRHYGELEVLLRIELAIAPDPHTRAVRDMIRDQKAALEPQAPGQQAQPDQSPIQLVPPAAEQALPRQVMAIAETAVSDASLLSEPQDLEDLPRKMLAVTEAAQLLIEALFELRESPALVRQAA